MESVRVTHYSDVLCVWAYVSQVRCDELVAQFPGRVSIDYRYMQVFGSVRAKMAAQWSEGGGIAGRTGPVTRRESCNEPQVAISRILRISIHGAGEGIDRLLVGTQPHVRAAH